MRSKFWGIPAWSLLFLSASACEGARRAPATSQPLTCTAPNPGAAPLHPLTRFQYDNAVRDLLGDTTHPSKAFPPENEVQGYRTNAAANIANPSLVESYVSAAEDVAARLVNERLDSVAPCAAGTDPIACGHAFVSSVAERAFRRPLASGELAPLLALFDAGNVQSYARGVELATQALLQSPQFLYRVDALKAPTVESGAVALGGYELASRLAFALWGSLPDADLMSAASQGRLATSADVEREARRLIGDPRAHDLVRDFSQQWLGLSRLDGAARDGSGVDPGTLANALAESLQRFVEASYFTPGGSFQQLLSSPQVWVNAALAPLYGVAPSADGFQAITLGEPRFGLLTQPALLTLLAHADQTAPVIRGVFVRERILCLAVAPPPPNVNIVPPDPNPNATTRERFRQHTEQPACSGCHKLIDGVGFGFERYDQLGRYRATENSLTVDESGEMLDSGDAALDGTFAGAGELIERISKSDMARDCLAANWYAYTFGRQEQPEDQCSVSQVKQRFAKSQGDLKELLVALTLSDSFLYRPAITEPP
jgi:hypothetical protein